MKKYLSLFLLFFATILFSIAQVPGELKWKENIAKNRIQTQIQWNHKYEKGKPKRNGYKNFSKRFDHNGNIIEEIYYQSGTVDQKLSYKYDNNENKVEFINYNGDENKVMFKQNITYDNSARKIREERYNGSDYQIIKYSYNTENRVSKIVRSDIYGNVEHKRIFNYKGNSCNISIYNSNDKETGSIVNKYDSNNNIIETIEYDDKDVVTEKYEFTFKENLVLEKTKYTLENFMYKEIYEYDAKGNLVKIKKEQPKGNIIVSNIYKYDSQNNLIEEQWYDSNPNENSKKSYFYNKKGILESVEVFYALYNYRIQYKFKYTSY
ncbi:MAG: hypothetical protein JEY96_02365 [Bacteroidales bacterium]|nr:hypothetical protein [Bacteroidales bacterium]